MASCATEELYKLESVDIAESKCNVSRMRKRLDNGRDPALLGELVEFYLATGSKQALAVLTSLKGIQSQDFFDKLNECVKRRSNRLGVLRLLAYTLNSQTSWLYKIVDHPLFSTILHYLKTSKELVVLTSALLVITAILPLVPSYLSGYLPDLFEIFTELATIRQTKRLGNTPKELYLHLDVALYYYFLQLYAMFPCSLFKHLREHYGPTGEVEEFQEYIAPLFEHVKLHPGLVTDANTHFETGKHKWGAMEPHEIFSLSFSMCTDPLIAVQDDTPVTVLQQKQQKHREMNPANLGHAPPATQLHAVGGVATGGATNSHPAAGLKTGPELAEMWSPSVAFGQTTPSEAPSRRSSRMSMLSHSVHNSTMSSPVSDSASSSAQHTPGPATTPAFTFSHKNYSPTSSINVDTESMLGHQLPSLTQSAIHFEESVGNSRRDPLSQSVVVKGTTSVHRSGGNAQGNTSPVRMAQILRTDKDAQMTQSLKMRFDKFIGIFSPGRKRTDSNNSADSEDFTEIFASDVSGHRQGQGSTGRRGSERSASLEVLQEWAGRQVRRRTLSVDEESKPEEDMHQEALFEVGHEEREGYDEGEEEGEERVRVNSREESVEERQDDTYVATPNASSEQPESDRHMDLTLGVYRDTRRFSHSGAVRDQQQDSEVTGSTLRQAHLFSSSFPGESSPIGRRVHSRARNSSSETDTNHTMLQVKDRLQILMESTQTVSEDPTDSASLSANSEDVSPKPEAMERERPQVDDERRCIHQHPPLHVVSSVDSTMTLLSSSPNRYTVNDYQDVGPKSRLLMRRVSVCSRKAPNQSESSNSGSGVVMGECPSSQVAPSPVFLLDQFVSHGEVLHRGNVEDIPLSELEGTDWYFFGGCPHSEEVQMMQSQVALLHNQLLFERHQCLQHARRNRRLLSKARSGIQLTQQLVQLRDTLRQQEGTIKSLREELQRSEVRQGASKTEERLRRENRELSVKIGNLEELKRSLSEEMEMLQRGNKELEDVVKRASERIFSLESERASLEPQLVRARELPSQVEVLTRELQVLGELYHQQREEAVAVLSHGSKQHEWKEICNTLREEKEAARRKVCALQLDLHGAQAQVQELQNTVVSKDQEIVSLRSTVGHMQARCLEKIKATEAKYKSMKVVSEQLEGHVMELRGRAVLKRRTHRHKRSSSHPTPHPFSVSLTPSSTYSSSPSPLFSLSPTPTPTQTHVS